MITVLSFNEVRATSAGRIGLAPTMGALHDGHLALFRAARSGSDTVVASIFVNPKQFGPDDDLDRYPRDLERDQTLAESAGVDVLFVPPVGEMYPASPRTQVSLGGLTEHFEGARRPGHFEGVALVVAKLLIGIRPTHAYFGRKDAQQLSVVQQLSDDLSIPVEIVPVSTVREPDGLALSSRNQFLSGDERAAAVALSRGLFAAASEVEGGERDGARLEQLVKQELAGHSSLQVEYVGLADSATASPLAGLTTDSFLAVAARIGKTRLIDNVAFSVGGDSVIVDRGELLAGPSVLEEA